MQRPPRFPHRLLVTPETNQTHTPATNQTHTPATSQAHTPETSRREFIKSGLGVAGFAAASSIMAACEIPDAEKAPDTEETDSIPEEREEKVSADVVEPEIEWEMAVSWRPELLTLYNTARFFATKVSNITGGRFKINPRPAGELVTAFDVLPAVRDLEVDVGYSASYYHLHADPVQAFGTTIPFGLTQRQQNAWLYHGGGLDLLNNFYTNEYEIIVFPAGGSGCQMGGWFTKEINRTEDLDGLRMHIPGLAGKVLEKFGVEVAPHTTILPDAIVKSMQDDVIDAAEFTGPADDLVLGFDEYEGRLYYYYPGWWEPGPVLEVQISLERWAELPPHYQNAVEVAAMAANLDSVASYDTRNSVDLEKVQRFAQIREFSPNLLAAFKEETDSLLDSIADENSIFADILINWRRFRRKIIDWHQLAELSYLSHQGSH